MSIDQTSLPRIIVFGANGGIGRHAVAQALHRGHTVVAIVRNPDNLILTHPKLTIQKGDVLAPPTLRNVFEKDDMVISAIGKNSTHKTTLYSDGDKNILHAMAEAGTSRLFVISASGLEVNPTHNFLIRWATRNILQRILKHMYADLARMEGIVKASPVNWTIVRPPRLTDGSPTGNYRVSIGTFLNKGTVIARADVAHFILANMSNTDTFRNTVEVAY